MSPQCPELVDPERFAKQESSCSGSVQLDHFERIAPMLSSQDGCVEFRFQFSRDMRRRPLLEGQVKGQLLLQCQRCLEPVELSVDEDFLLVVVQGLDEAEGLDEEYDPLIPEDERVNLLQLVEDELLLAIPPVPRHHECQAAVTESGKKQETQAQRENPFGALAALKKE